jgi:hypothetical protein
MRARGVIYGSWGAALLALAATGCEHAEPGSNSGAPGSQVDDDGVDTTGQRLAWRGPQFPGAGGKSGSSIAAGVDVITCDGKGKAPIGVKPKPGEVGHEQCFYDPTDSDDPAATIEWIVETAQNDELVHVRLTLNPRFVDNTYGDTAIGWEKDEQGMPAPNAPNMPKMPKPGKGGHTFKDLVGSDHAEFKLSDGAGKLALHFKLDYISESSSAPSGYATLGVSGGEGKMLLGNASDVVAATSSIDRDLNACGYTSYLEDSPETDEDYTPNRAAAAWDFRVVYDVWVRRAAFGAADFGKALVDFVHASPSKEDSNTIEVIPGECPPEWPPYCGDPAGCPEPCGLNQVDVTCNEPPAPCDPSLGDCGADAGTVLVE